MEDLEQFLNNLGCEDEHTEFKEAKNTFDVLGKPGDKKCIYGYCVALGNEGGGCLVLGVDDKRNIVGTSFPKDSFGSIKEEIYKRTGQKIDIEERFFDNKRIVIIRVPGRPVGQFYTFYDVPLMRVGQQLVVMSQEQQKKIFSEGQVDWTGQIAEKTSFDDIDENAILKAKENFATKFPNINKEEIDSWDVKVFLSKAKLLNNGKITNAALILLGKEESKALLQPQVAEITWVLKTDAGDILDYKHFSPPFIISIDEVFKKIRNLKYRYMKTSGSLFPEETDQYNSYVIREALNNCIAHQDYSKCARITVVEKTDSLVFTNEGSFIPKTIKAVIDTDMPPRYYRNKFLAEAMVNLNMIDTVGSGIKRMFTEQRARLFPLPSYDFSDDKVKVEIFGKIIDINYARLLAKNTDLSLDDIILLDAVQKKKTIEPYAVRRLRKKGYIEGRLPNIYISAMVAEKTGAVGEYLNTKCLDNNYYRKLILDYLKVSSAKRRELEAFILPKLSSLLTDTQKKKKLENILNRMRLKGFIVNSGNGKQSVWSLKK